MASSKLKTVWIPPSRHRRTSPGWRGAYGNDNLIELFCGNMSHMGVYLPWMNMNMNLKTTMPAPNEIDALIPETLSAETSSWHTKTHVSEIFRYGDLAVKGILPQPYICAASERERMHILEKEMEMACIYNNGDPTHIYKGIILRKINELVSEPYLVMSWLPNEARMDALLQNDTLTNDAVSRTVARIIESRSKLPLLGDEEKYCSLYSYEDWMENGFVISEVSLIRIGAKHLYESVRELKKKHMEHAEELGEGLFLERLKSGHFKCAFSDTKIPNIYVIDGDPVFLDPCVLRPDWQYSDILHELTALISGMIEMNKMPLARHAIKVFSEHPEGKKALHKGLAELSIAYWMYILGFVHIEHLANKKLSREEEAHELASAEKCIKLSHELVAGNSKLF